MSGNHRVESDCDSCLALRVVFDSKDVESGSDIRQWDGSGIRCA